MKKRIAILALASCFVFMTGLAWAQSASERTAQEPARTDRGTADPTGKSSLDRQDRNFVKEAASGSMLEVKLGELASQKASNPEVKQFGERMVRDHSMAGERLREIVQAKNVALPEKMERKHQRAYDKLARLSGEEFDRQYMSYMTKDHKKDIDLFRKEADKGKDPDLKSFASQTVQVLEEHQQLANNVSAKVGGTTRQ